MGAATDHTAARLAVARDLAARLDSPSVAAIGVIGSVARGWADRWSDLELMVVWETVPGEDERGRWLAAAGVSAVRSFPADAPVRADDEGRIAGLKVDVSHVATADLDAASRQLRHGEPGDAALPAQRLAASVLSGVPLAGEPAWASLVEGLGRYPAGLARRTLAGAVHFGPHAWLTMLAERGDVAPLHDALVRVSRTLLVAWFALNDRFVATSDGKWAGRYVATLPLVPVQAASRLRDLFEGPLTSRAAGAATLIDETLALADERFGADLVAPVRARVRSALRDPGWLPAAT